MADHKEDRIGNQIGPYRLTRLLGAGGFGEVYEADHQLIQQRRAIKLLLERHFHDPKQRERFLREARTLAELEHINILQVLEVDESGNLLYLVMPLYHRGTLSDQLKQRTTPPPLDEVKQYLAHICAALGYAHTRGIAHLDLKPENLLLHEDGRLVLADFGLAHLLKQGRLEAGTSASWGTPYYMAPEQIRGNPEPRSDLYALGIILYQLLTLQRPFTGNTPEAVMMQHMLEAPPVLQSAYPAAPTTLEPVVQKALAKKPADRYQTAEALLIDFMAALGSPSPAVPQPPPAGPATSAPSISSPAPVAQQPTPAAQNTLHPPIVGCEVLLPNSRLCGIPPVGRCSTCERAFCNSHASVYADRCAPCQAQAQADTEERNRAFQARRQAEMDEARTYVQSGAARAALLAAGVSPSNIYQIQSAREKKGFFSEKFRIVETILHVRRGWILGAIDGTYTAKYEASSATNFTRRLVALLDQQEVILLPVQFVSLRDPRTYAYPVQSEAPSERYEEERDKTRYPDWEITDIGWEQAARVVKLWLEKQHYTIGGQVPTFKPASLHVKNAKRREGEGQIYEIKGLLSIGHSSVSDIFLQSDSNHDLLQATILYQGNGNYVLRAEESLLINKQQGKRGQVYNLKDGDEIQFYNCDEMGVFRMK